MGFCKTKGAASCNPPKIKKGEKKDTGYWCVLLIIIAMKCSHFPRPNTISLPSRSQVRLSQIGPGLHASTHRHLHFHFPPVQLLIKFENSWVAPQLINKDTQ